MGIDYKRITQERISFLFNNDKRTKKELAKLLGLNTQNTITDWLSGNSKTYMSKLPEISECFNVSALWILGVSDNMTEKELAADDGSELPPEFKYQYSHLTDSQKAVVCQLIQEFSQEK